MKRPLAFIGAVYAVAQLLAAFLPQAFLLALAAFFILCGGILLRRSKRIALAVFTMATAFVLHFCYIVLWVSPLQSLEGFSQITATVTQVQSSYTDGMVRGTLKLEKIDGAHFVLPRYAYCTAMPECERGERVTFKAQVASNTDSRYRSANYANGIFISLEKVDEFSVVTRQTASYYLGQIKRDIAGIYRRYFSKELAMLVSAVCVGDKQALPETIRTQFTQAGLAHILVLSGFHLSLLCGVCYLLLRKLISNQAAAICTLCIAAAFIAVVGHTPSLLRAFIAMALLFIGPIVGRQSDGLTSLGAAALLLCLQNPYAVLDYGMQLSFCATLAVLCTQSAVLQLLQKQSKLVRELVLCCIVSVAVSLICFPVLACMGGGISLLSVLTNLVASIVLPFIVISGLLLALCSCFSILWLPAAVFAVVCGGSAKLLGATAAWAQSVTGSFVQISEPVAAVVVIIVFILAGYGVWREFAPKRILFFCVLLLFCSVGSYLLLDANVVRIAVVGNTQNPAVILYQRGNAAIIYRGTSSNLEAVQQWLSRYNCHRVSLVVDLNKTQTQQTAVQQSLQPEQYVAASNLQNNATLTPFYDIIIGVRHQADGNYACVAVYDKIFGISMGKVDLSNAPEMTYFLGGTVQPLYFSTKQLMLPESVQWDGEHTTARVQNGSLLMLRKGGTSRFYGVTYDFE